MTQEFDTAFAGFLQGVEQRNRAGNDPAIRIETDVGPRYIRVVCVTRWNGEDRRSVYCFVDRTDGEVLKAGGWKQPVRTKQSRGNIFDANNGLGAAREHSLAYLR